MVSRGVCLLFICFLLQFSNSAGKKEDKGGAEANKWKKKDVRDYTDADVERLYEQWEDADEDELEPDEQPEWKREPPAMDMSKLDPSKPEEFLKMSKKGRTLMMFATVAGNPTEAETEKISALWHSSLFNANIETQRFVVGSNRVLFMCRDGAMAWDIRDFLVTQDNCESVEIEGQTFHGRGSKQETNDTKSKKKDSEEKKKTKKDSKNDIKKTKTKTKKGKEEL
ncbi:LRP chaperone MESD-like [Babylonia areolata]|uniref:LRP chaperone MESD-like n=1 Tax=Babylonia areolata TaxID=304850 RepID=UPI003FD30F16